MFINVSMYIVIQKLFIVQLLKYDELLIKLRCGCDTMLMKMHDPLAINIEIRISELRIQKPFTDIK